MSILQKLKPYNNENDPMFMNQIINNQQNDSEVHKKQENNKKLS